MSDQLYSQLQNTALVAASAGAVPEFPPDMSWNEVAIQMNNQAMEDLENGGNILAAYLNLSGAITAVTKAIPPNHHEATSHDQDDAITAAYAYSWMKCPNESILNQLTSQANTGYLSFMCLRFLKIETNATTPKIDCASHCPCQFSWAIYYNVGILCTVLGMVLGRQAEYTQLSSFMLQQGKSFLDSVLVRVEAEQPNNRDWATVHISVLLNQALGDLEGLVANSHIANNGCKEQQHVAVTLNAHSEHLKRTNEYLQAYSRFFGFQDLMEFFFSLQPFMSNVCAQAA